MVDVKLPSNNVDSLVGDVLVMSKPFEIIRSDLDIVGHYLFESFIIGEDKKVDHDYVTHFQSVDHLGEGHITESIEDDKSRFGIGLDVCFYLSEDVFGILS